MKIVLTVEDASPETWSILGKAIAYLSATGHDFNASTMGHPSILGVVRNDGIIVPRDPEWDTETFSVYEVAPEFYWDADNAKWVGLPGF